MINTAKIISEAIKGIVPEIAPESRQNAEDRIAGCIINRPLPTHDAVEAAKRSLDAAEAANILHRDLTTKRVEVLNAELAHFEMIKKAGEQGGWGLCPRFVIPEAPGLCCHEIKQQLRTDLAPLLSGFDNLYEDLQWQPLTTAAPDLGAIDGAAKFDLRRLRNEDIAPNSLFANELRRNGLYRPPFDVCWFEWEIVAGATIGALQRWEDREHIDWWGRVHGSGWARWAAVMPPEYVFTAEVAVHGVVEAACVILLSRCAERLAVLAPEPLNQRRAKLGRPPLYSHTIVEIRALQLSHDGQATMIRRSPRQHWRRGHIRRLRDKFGSVHREIPIAPMLVGNISHGHLTHDYIIEPPAKSAADFV